MKHLSFTEDASKPFDAVVLLESEDASSLFAALAEQHRLAVPVINATGQTGLPGISMALPDDPTVGEQISQATATIRSRLKALPEPRNPADAAGLQVLAICHALESDIRAEWFPDRPEMVCYPALPGVPDARDLLENLAASDLLRRSSFDSLHSCSACGSARLNVREECPDCRSSNIAEKENIHHYRCAYIGPASEFEKERRLTCPKCAMELRHYGVDYDRPGTAWHCLDCAHTSDEPAVGFVCTDCGAHTTGDIIGKRAWYHYALTTAGINAVRTGMLPTRSLADSFSRIMGTYALRDLALVGEIMSAAAARYERPMSAFQLEIGNRATLETERSSTDMADTFALMASLVGETLRTCDMVAIRGDSLFILLPETEESAAGAAFERIRQKISETIKDEIDLSIAGYSGESMAEFLELLKQ